MLKPTNIQKITTLALFVSIALILSYIETLIPINLVIPGAKMGLANIVTMTILLHFGVIEAFIVSLLRILITGMAFTNFYMMLYSLVGGLLSLIMMVIFKKMNRFSLSIISIIGGISHNIGQLLVAMVFFDSSIFIFYLPYLIIIGSISGLAMGLLSTLVNQKISPYLK